MFGFLREKIEDSKSKLKCLHLNVSSDDSMSKIREEEKNLSSLLNRKEIFWAQKSRINWLKWGDRILNYFTNLLLKKELGIRFLP